MNSSPLPPAAEKAAYVNRMFADIAPRYDLMNRLMTGGQDVAWRRQVINLCKLPRGGRLLDVGTGTGDIAYEACRAHPGLEAIGCDFTFEMMAVSVTTEPTFLPGNPEALFASQYRFSVVGVGRSWDVGADGRFLMIRGNVAAEDNVAPPHIVVVQNWFQELTERVPVP